MGEIFYRPAGSPAWPADSAHTNHGTPIERDLWYRWNSDIGRVENTIRCCPEYWIWISSGEFTSYSELVQHLHRVSDVGDTTMIPIDPDLEVDEGF